MIAPGLVSTIIPVRNRAGMVREAIASVLAQDYRPIEIVVVDDGSTDDTPEALAALAAAHPEITVVRRQNGGPGPARESGRAVARGAFIQYLDSDDLLLPGKFSAQVAGLAAHPECGVAYGKTRLYELGSAPKDKAWKRTGEDIAAMFPGFLADRWWGTATPLYRREVTDRAGPWLSLINEEDWEYDCRIAAEGVRLFNCAIFVSDKRIHPGEQLSRGGTTDPRKLASRAIAHERIYAHARRAGIDAGTDEMRHFARDLFRLARQCGGAGLAAEAERIFALARAASTEERARGWDFRLYGLAARLVGWQTVGRAALHLDRLR